MLKVVFPTGAINHNVIYLDCHILGVGLKYSVKCWKMMATPYSANGIVMNWNRPYGVGKTVFACELGVKDLPVPFC